MKNSKIDWRYVYYLYFENGELAYVGSSIMPGTRLRAHCAGRKQKFTMKLGEYLSEKEALDLELAEIIRLHPPLNKKRGANTVAMQGRKHTPETLEKMRKVHSHPRPASYGPTMSRILKGRTLSVEHRLALSKAKLANPEACRAKGYAMGKANKGRGFTEDHKLKIGLANQGRRVSTETRNALSNSISSTYARRKALGIPTGAAMRQGAWRDKMLYGPGIQIDLEKYYQEMLRKDKRAHS